MTATRTRPAIVLAGLLLGLLAVNLQGVQAQVLDKVPSEDQCRPYIEKALKDLGTEGSDEQLSPDDDRQQQIDDTTGQDDDHTDQNESGADIEIDDESKSREKRSVSAEETSENEVEQVTNSSAEHEDDDEQQTNSTETPDSKEDDEKSSDNHGESKEEAEEQVDEQDVEVIDESSEQKDEEQSDAADDNEVSASAEEHDEATESKEATEEETPASAEPDNSQESKLDEIDSKEEVVEEIVEAEEVQEVSAEAEQVQEESVEAEQVQEESVEAEQVQEESVETEQVQEESVEAEKDASVVEEVSIEQQTAEEQEGSNDSNEPQVEESSGDESETNEDEDTTQEQSSPEEEELIMEIEIPEVLRARDHIGQLLKLDEESEDKEKAVEKVADVVLRDLKRLYDNAIKPLETLYKYRDLSNRHFGDPEIFSKPLVLFMGPWSGGKSSIINYLLDLEYKPTSLRTGAEPSPAYFNILMHGEEEEVLDGTQLAADWTFSGLQKFGQGLLDRLKGYKLKSKLLEKVNIVEIPGILEIRKQVQRLFPFNDACQWFIDRADIIFLVYDPSKLDVGPETEAILDQLKGREYQTRIILNKADQVKPEELMRVQGALIWNISPLMSSAEPPVMYSASLWSIPYEAGAPTRLLYAQERAFLRDLRSAIDKRVEHKIASARRFAVRVRNHAKMVDCYLTTYYNHKSFFAKKKDVAERIVDSPQDYHIYEGLSTLTNISRYDLPDPDVYRDFFRLNNLYDFPLLSSTCTYFRGCPINRLDVAIAYDLPELVGKYKKTADAAAQQLVVQTEEAPTPTPQLPVAAAQTQKAKSSASKLSLS